MIRIVAVVGIISVVLLPFVYPAKSSTSNKDIVCLATNIYHEARGESTVGKIAVGLVVLNRVAARRWPDSICSVVYEGPIVESWSTKKDKSLSKEERRYYPLKNKCQFSWWCDGAPDTINYSSHEWAVALQISEKLLSTDKFKGLLEGATHYHTINVSPSWRLKMTLITRIDNHLFYRQD